MEKYDLISRWTELNRKLEASWNPLHPLVAERDEIEKQLPWLKGHGASPFPPKTQPPAPPPEQPPAAKPPPKQPPPEENKQKRKKPSTTGEKIRDLTVMKNVPPPITSPSATPLNQDSSQNF
jgi:hypothetical protein